MRCSCAALAALLEVLEETRRSGVRPDGSAALVEVLSAVTDQTARTLERELARCAFEVGTTTDDVRDLCEMFPPLEDCGRYR